jgi:hypothetical protein
MRMENLTNQNGVRIIFLARHYQKNNSDPIYYAARDLAFCCQMKKNAPLKAPKKIMIEIMVRQAILEESVFDCVRRLRKRRRSALADSRILKFSL